MTQVDSVPFAWHDGFLLGHAPMDHVHEEFVRLVAALSRAPDESVQDAFRLLADHMREHFNMENAWMTATAFPAHECHIDEHAAVMSSLEAVRPHVMLGDYAEARRLAAALADWFPGHADYLDAPLAHWMCKRRFGGKPVVVRRHIDSLLEESSRRLPMPISAGQDSEDLDKQA